jgi:asparagine synthase (glutamine-hydrolysing)
VQFRAPGTDDVHVITRGASPTSADRPTVVWVAPGSRDPATIERVFGQRGRLDDLARLSGPWAAVLWDPARREHLVVADPVGVQPLYWAHTASGDIAVSSWLAALVDRPDVDDALDPEGVFIESFRGVVGEAGNARTVFRAVRRSTLGTALAVTGGLETSVVRYWDPSVIAVDESITLPEAAELLRERIDAAVRTDIADGAGAVRFGAHVSGGLDCTAVACRAHALLAESGGGLVSGFSWSPDPNDMPIANGDERHLLVDVSEQNGLPLTYARLRSTDTWFSGLDRHRYPSTTHVAEQHVLPVARDAGVHVLLSGWGGDELASFNGRKVMDSLVRSGRWGAVWSNATRRDAIVEGRTPTLPRKLRVFGGAVLHAMPSRVQGLRAPRAAAQDRRHERWVRDELRARYPDLAAIREAEERTWSKVSDHHELQGLLLTRGHLQHRCAGWYQTGRLFGISYRYPLLHVGVVEAALSLPWTSFRHEGWSRIAFRTAVEPWVPASVAWNMTKMEPAFFGALAQARSAAPPDTPAAPVPKRSLPADVQAAVDFAAECNRGRSRRGHTLRPVVPRPDAAPATRLAGG